MKSTMTCLFSCCARARASWKLNQLISLAAPVRGAVDGVGAVARLKLRLQFPQAGALRGGERIRAAGEFVQAGARRPRADRPRAALRRSRDRSWGSEGLSVVAFCRASRPSSVPPGLRLPRRTVVSAGAVERDGRRRSGRGRASPAPAAFCGSAATRARAPVRPRETERSSSSHGVRGGGATVQGISEARFCESIRCTSPTVGSRRGHRQRAESKAKSSSKNDESHERSSFRGRQTACCIPNAAVVKRADLATTVRGNDSVRAEREFRPSGLEEATARCDGARCE